MTVLFKWRRCPQSSSQGPPLWAEVNAKISVLWVRRQGGEDEAGRGRTQRMERRGREEEKRGGEGRVGPGCWCEFEAKEGRGERKISIYGKKTEGSIEPRREPFTLRELLSEVWRRWMRRRKRGEVVHLIRAADPFFPPLSRFRPTSPLPVQCNRRWGRRTRQRRRGERCCEPPATLRDVEERGSKERRGRWRGEHVCSARANSGNGR